jgi:GNAT superfamily N-acetyltransferase
MLVARKNQAVIGVAVLAHTWTIDRGGFCTWLDELYVLPEERDRGVGTALLHHAIEVARSLGCRAVDLEVEFDHARVEGLYLREGFTVFRRRHFTLPLTL